MSNYTVDAVNGTEDAKWQGLNRTFFNSGGQTMYILTKPGGEPKAGDVLDGSVAPDARGNLKFTKTKTFGAIPTAPLAAPQGPSAPVAATQPVERTFKADPAKQSSIEWQASIKAAVEAVRNYHATFIPSGHMSIADYKREIINTAITFSSTIENKPDRSISPPQAPPPAPPPIQPAAPEQPPITAYQPDQQINLDDIPF